MAYEINYNDKRFTEVTEDKNAALKESAGMYDQMINGSDKFYQAQIDATKEYGDTQTKLQQEKTDFEIEQIEQQKDQAYQDYKKEQTGAWVDYQKQSNQYGSNAEQMAANGLAYTGFSESSQVSMFNTYQNRYAMAREVYNRSVLNYDNAMKDARLQNNSALAEIAFNTLQTSLELGLQGFLNKNQLLLDKANKKAEIEDRYYGRWQNVLQQMNTENAMAEQIRQYNESLAEERRQFNETMAFNKAKSFNSGGGGSRSSAGSSGSSGKLINSGTLAPSIEEQEKDSYSKALLQQIGMNRTVEGRVNTIQRLQEDGAITESQAKKLLAMYTE